MSSSSCRDQSAAASQRYQRPSLFPASALSITVSCSLAVPLVRVRPWSFIGVRPMTSSVREPILRGGISFVVCACLPAAAMVPPSRLAWSSFSFIFFFVFTVHRPPRECVRLSARAECARERKRERGQVQPSFWCRCEGGDALERRVFFAAAAARVVAVGRGYRFLCLFLLVCGVDFFRVVRLHLCIVVVVPAPAFFFFDFV
jgi:hypothetical protein